ncbi:MAG: hypothetical protein KKE30_16675 [Gammaproteobacteria bacterium]|nr:hypothetical protein [Gammaproteobacteria bacterium]MBU1555419.1 hypothetical protein [Gammaproteobacteria bacterium]MBU2070291.1 hypothetical protein [Gammaproteobacteria bacterium]MBU2185329.1 hypothetical protein [Gammaproteobacteria bacterium]MBU2203577.1 hypothetical protein [Gammaproteobacteria bacterium]
MQPLKNWWQGFAGGPDFNRQQKLSFLLEEYSVQLTLPYSNIASAEPPKQVNYPFRSNSWFEQHQQQKDQHKYVPIHTEGWCYLAPLLRFDGGEYGWLWLNVWLKTVPDGVDALDRQALAKNVINEHDQHYNSAAIGAEGDYGLGRNTEIESELKEYAELRASRGSPFTEERYRDELQGRINNYGFPPLQPAKLITLQGFEWVFYQEKYDRHPTRTDLYCLPLSCTFYLVIGFKHRVDNASEKSWQKDAENVQRKIMEQVNVSVMSESTALLSSLP